jgi:16S rRNA C967 or C1407 C5-methylase (RsmB/RsmF family)
MTCAYSIEENEQVSDWLLTRFLHFKPIAIPHLSNYQSHIAPFPCYRMFPQSGLGAGAFTVLFQNTETGDRTPYPTEFLQRSNVLKV